MADTLPTSHVDVTTSMNLLSLGKNTLENTNKLLLLVVLLARTGADFLPTLTCLAVSASLREQRKQRWRAVAGLECTPEGSCPSLLFPLGSAGVSFSQGALPGLGGFDLGRPYLSLSCVTPRLKRMAGRWCF